MAGQNVVMLLGNTGVGKSSIGCRLLGFDPRVSGGPFKVGHGAFAETAKLQEEAGSWFGQANLANVRVVDTPGLADPKGMKIDLDNMKEMAEYLQSKPVNSILFVLDASLRRINLTLQRLMQIVIRKVHPKDYDKLAIAVNCYSHSETAQATRAEADSSTTEAEKQMAWTELVLAGLTDFTKLTTKAEDRLDLTADQIEGFRKRIFLIHAHHNPTCVGDQQAFEALMQWSVKHGEIDRTAVSAETGDVYPEWQAALDRVECLRDVVQKDNMAYVQTLHAIETKAAEQQAVLRLKDANFAEETKLKIARLEQQLQATDERARVHIETMRQQFAADLEKAHELCLEEMRHLQEEQEAERRHAAEMKELADQVRKAEQAAAEEHYLGLSAQAFRQWQVDGAKDQKPSFLQKLLPVVTSFIPGVGPMIGAVVGAATSKKTHAG